MAKKNLTGATAEKTIRLRNFVLENPGLTQEEVMAALKIKTPAGLYSLLLGLAGDAHLCTKGQFNIYNDGKYLHVSDMEDFLESSSQQEKTRPGMTERLLYLYYSLHNAIPAGGLSLSEIRNIYEELFLISGEKQPKTESLKRMIYRDLLQLEKLHIGIERPETGSKKYCLRDKYLPKLTAEGAAAVYVSMLLYRDTLLDEATVNAKGEIEKAFFKGFPERSKALRERIYVLNDTLASPADFGNILGSLIRAVAECIIIKTDYMNNEGHHSERILEPLGLISKRNVWYLIARKAASDDIRTYRVDQIISLSLREQEKFTYPADFSLNSYIGSSWGVFHNDEPEQVLLKFSRKVAHRVTNLCYHPSQQIVEKCKDGSIIIQFEVCGLVEMQSWILQWGEQVEVIKPHHLRETIRELAKAIGKKYKKR